MDIRTPMKTMSEVMQKLAGRGITKEFCINESGDMKITDSDKVYNPQDLKILKSYRFEGDSNPADNSVLYVAEDHNGNLGMIIDSYGAESNYPGDKFDDFLRKIPIEEREEFDIDSL